MSDVITKASPVFVEKNNFSVALDLGTTVPCATAHLEIFHCTHHPVIPKSDLYFSFCSALKCK